MRPDDIDPDSQLWSAEAESSVLGGLLVDAGAFDRAGDLLLAKHFHLPAHGEIYTVIAALALASKPVDPVTVFVELEKSGKGEQVGGLAYLNSLAQYVPSASNIRRYAEIVAEKALLRGLVEAAGKVREIATEKSGRSVAQRLDAAQSALQSVQIHGGRAMPEAVQSIALRLMDRIQSVADGKPVVTGIPCGIPAIDHMMGGGFKGGKQVILAARPSVGKSSLAMQFCLNLAAHGAPIAFLSQEMSKDELVDRALANWARIPLDRVISGRLEKDDWSRYTEGLDRINTSSMFFDDQGSLGLPDVAAKARAMVRQHGVKLIVLDYLQLCAGASDDDSRHHQIEALSRGIKGLAKQLDVTFLTLSQLNREVEKRSTGRPVLSDLKESGAIEEDADIVMMLSRGQPTPGGMQIINCDIPKNRQGKVGTVTLGFEGAYQMWTECIAPVQFTKPASRSYTEEV